MHKFNYCPYAAPARLVLSALLVTCAFRALGDPPQLSVGAKVWANEWTSWAPTTITTSDTSIEPIESISSNTHVAVIPQGSVRYENLLLTASYLARTTYVLGGAINPNLEGLTALTASRKEFDANIGYYVLPRVVVTLGYKQIDQNFQDPNLPYRWVGPTIGISTSSPLVGALAMYGTFAYGRLRLTTPVSDPAGDSHFNADYLLAELGLGYSMGTALPAWSFSINVGYRAQVVSTRKLDVYTGFGSYQPVDVHDVTQGPAISVLTRF